eukprot:jgi/Ulvmu1/4712/UM002_0443.1
MITIPSGGNPTTTFARRSPAEMQCIHGKRMASNLVHRASTARCVRNYAVAAAERLSAHSPELTGRLRDYTAVLEVPNSKTSTGHTKIYILAVSHVSRRSVTDTVNLIEQVRPDVVMIEVCKDRLGLLATPFPPGEQVWHTPSVRISGIPDLPGFPKADDLLSLLTCKSGRPISTMDIEEDARALQATGLFRTVRPTALPGTNQDAPLFIFRPNSEADGKGAVCLDTVPPFNAIDFRCDPRSLPRVTSFSLRVESTAQEAGAEMPDLRARSIEAQVKEQAGREDVQTLQVLMEARARILAAADAPVPLSVQFDNVESGNVEAVLRLAPEDAFVSGLEASATGGMGFGIDTFKAPRQNDGLKVGLTSMLPAQALEKLARQHHGEQRLVGAEVSDGEGGGEATTDGRHVTLPHEVLRGRGRSAWRRWGWRELATAADEDPEPQPLKDALANSMSQLYGKLQRRAGTTVGVDGGDVWRAATEAAARAGTAQVLLGDRPAFVTQRRLAQGIWGALAPRVAVGLIGFNMAILAGAAQIVPAAVSYEAMGASLAVTLALLTPVALPYFEMWRFSGMGAEEIEETVSLPEAVQQNLDKPLKIRGEDALLDWPGAGDSILAERDLYMAKALAAAATGGDGQVPAFVLDEVDGHTVYRYMMADGAPNKSAPTGKGDGAYQPLDDAESIVAVVGSAHVRGICVDWKEACRDVTVDKLLAS